MSGTGPADCSVSFTPGLPGVTEVFHASFTDHRYPLHCHDTWTVLLVDDGRVAYGLGRHQRVADRQRVTILPPHIAHDGRAATPGTTFRKRVLYLDGGLLDEELVGRAVDRSASEDRMLRGTISALHETFGRPADHLEQEVLLSDIVTGIGEWLGAAPLRPSQPSSEAAEALRAELDDRPFEPHRLADIAEQLGWNVAHLARSFRHAFGLPPHRYLVAKRIDEARRQLLAGRSPAQVATGVGFHDQAHLGRHFKAHVGTTPGRFQRRGEPGWTGQRRSTAG